MWDFTCTDTFAPTYVANSATNIGSAAKGAEEIKNKKHDFLLDRFIFVPIAIETTGVWGHEGLVLVKAIGNRISTLTSLLVKHPIHPEPSFFPDEPPLPENNPIIETSEIQKSISNFPAGSAGGLDALGPQILKDLTHAALGETGKQLVEKIEKFLGIILAGKVHASICPIFCGASLTALKKKTGGIRPIAVGNVWRRLTAKIISARIAPNLQRIFSPHQLGVGIRGGAEAGSDAARIYFNATHNLTKGFYKARFSKHV
jgi:hypothetical protein